jgi:DNA-binding XRE family transcriptional regulator
MNLSDKLICLREYWKYSTNKVSKALDLDDDLYIQLETGESKINKTLAEKLSNFYSIPTELLIADDFQNHLSSEIIYSNCSFDNGSSGYINHQYNDRGIDEILFMKKEEAMALNQQIDYLIKENLILMEIIKTGTHKGS